MSFSFYFITESNPVYVIPKYQVLYLILQCRIRLLLQCGKPRRDSKYANEKKKKKF